MPFADSQGVQIHYEVTGTGDPLLLIMGYGMPGSSWALSLPHFSPRFQTVYYDNRGTGESDAPDCDYNDFGLFARDAQAVMDAMGWGSAHVYGASMGGMIAQQLALDAPKRVRSLVLGCTSCGRPEPTPEVMEARRILGEAVGRMQEDPEGYVRDTLPLSFTQDFIDRHPELVPLTVAFIKASKPTRRAPQIREPAADENPWRVCDRLGELEVPVLILHGTEDRLIPLEHAQEIFSRVKRAELRVFKGVGHVYQAFGQAVVDRGIAEWIASHAAG